MKIREEFVCAGVLSNNGIKRVHLTHDEFKNEHSQPTEMLINIPAEIFERGKRYLVEITELSDGTQSH